MLNSEQGKAVTKKYLTVAKAMREYEDMVRDNVSKAASGQLFLISTRLIAVQTME
jgi:hypothetical protein